MRAEGRWDVGADGIARPVIAAGLVGPGGAIRTFAFLIDTGADSTLLTYWAVTHLEVEVEPTDTVLQGVGGPIPAVAVEAHLHVLNTKRELIRLGGRLFGEPYPTGGEDELCILGRDLMNNFAVIVDRPADTVCLVSGRHRYVIEES